MERRFVLALLAVIGLFAGGALADLQILNIFIDGSLSAGASVSVTDGSIDFAFPNAAVGDPFDPLRVGNLTMTFEVLSTEPSEPVLLDELSVLGALAGSGKIFFNEVVEDLAGFGILATHSAILDSPDDLPYTANLLFDRPSTHIKVKKSLVLTAVPDTPEFDLANVSLVEQTFRVPEPTMVLPAGIVAAAFLRRR